MLAFLINHQSNSQATLLIPLGNMITYLSMHTGMEHGIENKMTHLNFGFATYHLKDDHSSLPEYSLNAKNIAIIIYCSKMQMGYCLIMVFLN